MKPETQMSREEIVMIMEARSADFYATLARPLDDQELDAALREAFERGARAMRDIVAEASAQERIQFGRGIIAVQRVQDLPLPKYTA